MAFAAGLHVFPGGAVDPADADPVILARCDPGTADPYRVAAVRELFEEVGILLTPATIDPPEAAELEAARMAILSGAERFIDACERLNLRLATSELVPLSRWITPPILPRRFDARIYAAGLPASATVTSQGGEVIAYEWLTPRDALDGLAVGRIRMWLPTSTTLQRLEHIGALDAATRSTLSPGRADPPATAEVAPDVIRVIQPSGAGVDGLIVNAYLVGGRELVAIDAGDPSEEALLAIVEATAQLGTIGAVALTSADPDHAGGSEHLREGLSVSVHGGEGAGRPLPYPVAELRDGSTVPAGDVRLVVVAAAGPRPDHVVYWIPTSRTALVGDLVGPPAGHSIPGPPDPGAWMASLDRLRTLDPVRLLPAHGEGSEGPAAVEAAISAAERWLSRGAVPRGGS
jgi:glyoxylase-like metal-dependent hydrolase (beta-lactamase superfamily II)/8-oxo-dGTP pyrophosphatase MutT (NUDIX family)